MTRPRLLLSCLVAGACLLFRSAFPLAQSLSSEGDFDPVAVVDGSEISRADCAKLEADNTAIWVDVGGRTACIRYYAAGLNPAPVSNKVAAIWMNGDVLGPSGRNADRRQSGFGPRHMIELEQQLSGRFEVPSIYLGRPGTYGSSGKHYTTRGRPIEAQLINAALDGIKRRYSIQAYALGGHSGGGTLVAEMLARRDDLQCAVISSGASAYRAYLEARGLLQPGGALSRFDPYESLDRVPASQTRRVFVIGDPRETNVPFSAQQLYFQGLRQRGHAAWLIPLERARDSRHHDLVDFGETANLMCASGASTDRIIATLVNLPEPAPRRSN